MAVQVKIDHIDTLSMNEVNGAVTEVVRRAIVTGMIQTDYTILQASLNQVGIPEYGDSLDGDGFEGLILTERNPRVQNDDAGTVLVDLVYKSSLGNQELGRTNVLGRGSIYGTGRASVVQKTTNFYVPYGGSVQPVQAAEQITVEHTFPNDDPDFPGQTITQGGEVSVYVPEANFAFEAFINVSNPWGTVAAVLGKINNGLFLSQPAYTWMCTEVMFNIVKPGRYKFKFEFQLNLDTWDPEAIFIDQRTGRPPPGLVPGVGYKQLPYNARANFPAMFGTLFEGYQVV